MGSPRSKDKYPIVYVKKSFADSSRSFVTPDYSRKDTWYYDAALVVDEVATNEPLDYTNYVFGSDRTVINLKYVSDRNDWQSRKVTVKKNDVVIATGFTLTYNTDDHSTVVFTSPLTSDDIIKVSYAYAQTSKFELIATAGKCIKMNYVESQFSVGAILGDTLRFEMVLNNPNTGNADYVAGFYEYQTAADYFNKANLGVLLPAFGELTLPVITFPWDYQTGYTIKPVGDATTDPTKGEFNKIRIYLKNDILITACEIATGTFYCFVEPLEA